MENLPIEKFASSPLKAIEQKVKESISPEEKSLSFGKILGDLVQQVNALDKSTGQSIEKLITGEADNIHQVMIAAEEASLTFSLMMEIRNKLIEAYQEIMRMQI